MVREITALLQAAAAGDDSAQSELFTRVESELKTLAHRELGRWPPGASVQTTALVDEIFLRLVGKESTPTDRRHFYAIAARAMHEALIDRARLRGRRPTDVPLPDGLPDKREEPVDLIDLKQALAQLEGVDPRACEVLRLRIVLGLEFEEIVALLEVSQATVERDLRFARTWLRRRMAEEPEEGQGAGASHP